MSEEIQDIQPTLPEPAIEELSYEALIKKAAALAAAGASKYKVQKELGVSQYMSHKIWRDDQFKKLLEEIGNDAVAASKSQMKSQLAKLGGLAIKAIEANLKKHNLNAAIAVLRSMGVETAGEKDVKAGGFTLVLAGQQAKTEPTKADVAVVDNREELEQ